MKRVLVTGGAGYIGSQTCKALARAGYLPVTYDNMSAGNPWAVRWGPLEIGDILDADGLREVMRRHRPIACIHLAALALVGESVAEPDRYYRTNVVGTLNLLDVARAHDIGTVVFSSSCATYGVPDCMPISEDTPQAPINPYGASKLMAERLLADFDAAFGVRHATLRYFNAAGADPDGELGEARVDETHLIPLALGAVLGLRPPLQVMGNDYPTPDGTAIRDYIHVADLADAHVAALSFLLAGNGSTCLNLGTGLGRSVQEILSAIERVTGRRVPHQMRSRRVGDPAVLMADPTRGARLLGLRFERSQSLDQVIETAWAWHRRDDRGGLAA